MAEEKEILTILSKEEYQKVLEKLTKKFGKPKLVKRLSLQCTDYTWADVDTRIKITNGETEIIQKVGDYRTGIRDEIKIPLLSDPQIILEMYKIFRNAIKGNDVQMPVMQYENFLFEDKNIEIKVSHQFGKSDAYNCEVEVMDAKLEPRELAIELDIPIHLTENTVDFWKKWNEKVNLDANKLSDKELMKLIVKYTNNGK